MGFVPENKLIRIRIKESRWADQDTPGGATAYLHSSLKKAQLQYLWIILTFEVRLKHSKICFFGSEKTAAPFRQESMF